MNWLKKLHIHRWENYERIDSLILRDCDCGAVQRAIFIEEPEKCSTARTILPKNLEWKDV